jgi:hypothetical protein
MLQPKPLRHWRRTIRLLKSRVAKFTQMTISVQEILTVQEAAHRRKDIRLTIDPAGIISGTRA